MSAIATKRYWPDLIILFDVTFENAKERMAGRDKGATDYFDRKGKDFFDALIARYKEMGILLSMDYSIPTITINTNNRTLDQVIDKTEYLIDTVLKNPSCST
jgi:thymidylate kinase